MWSRIAGSTIASSDVEHVDLAPRRAARPPRPRRPPRAAARRSTRCGRTSTASASSRERSSSCSTSDGHARRLLLERERAARPSALVESRSPRWFSVWTKPWIVVTGVRSSCAASATKFVISSFARSSASRDSVLLLEEPHAVERDPGQRRDRLQRAQLLVAEERRVRRRPRRCSVTPGSSTSTASSGRASGSPLRRRAASPVGVAQIDAARAPTSAGGRAERRAAATSARVVASVIRPRIASCSRCCSGARQEARTSCGGSRPSRKRERARRTRAPGRSRRQRECCARRSAEPMIATVSAAEANASMPHAVRGDGRLAAPGPPEPRRDDDREQRPVDEEGDDVGDEAAGQ